MSNSQLPTWLNFKTLPLPQTGACCQLVVCPGKMRLRSLIFPCWVCIQVRERGEVRGIRNMTVTVAVKVSFTTWQVFAVSLFSHVYFCVFLRFCCWVLQIATPIPMHTACSLWLSLLSPQLPSPQPCTAAGHTLAQGPALFIRNFS